jgi:HSP20 family molecular chaperone IbpA
MSDGNLSRCDPSPPTHLTAVRADDRTWSPDIDVFERGGTLVVRVDLPGTTLSDVRVKVSQDEVTVFGRRRQEPHEVDDKWLHAERAFGRFCRVIELTAGAWPEKAGATFAGGVLEIKVPVMVSHDSRTSASATDYETFMVAVQPGFIDAGDAA